jgi:A/G-specific adenine glycosylase
MELGATVCGKHAPDCARCPVRAGCSAHASGRQAELPVPRPRTAPRRVAMSVLVATHGSVTRGTASVWLERGEGTLFGGLWNLPAQRGHGHTRALALQRLQQVGGRLPAAPVARIEQVLRHRRLELELWRVAGARGRAAPGLHAVALGALGTRGVSALTRKALAACGLLVTHDGA